MAISVTDLKHRCLEIVRQVERTGRSVPITRRGRVVARLTPEASATGDQAVSPWERLRALGGALSGEPGESVIRAGEFKALR